MQGAAQAHQPIVDARCIEDDFVRGARCRPSTCAVRGTATVACAIRNGPGRASGLPVAPECVKPMGHRAAMFKNLQTSTKLLILCGLFIVSLGVVSYQLIVEKRVTIGFARKELVGNRYLSTLREIYVSVLVDPPSSVSAGSLSDSRAEVLNALASA